MDDPSPYLGCVCGFSQGCALLIRVCLIVPCRSILWWPSRILPTQPPAPASISVSTATMKFRFRSSSPNLYSSRTPCLLVQRQGQFLSWILNRSHFGLRHHLGASSGPLLCLGVPGRLSHHGSSLLKAHCDSPWTLTGKLGHAYCRSLNAHQLRWQRSFVQDAHIAQSRYYSSIFDFASLMLESISPFI